MSPRQDDLFGKIAPSAARDTTPVTLALTEHPAGATDKAWMLSKSGQGPKFAPRSLVTRGQGTQAQFFTMPRWKAAELGWL